MRAVMGECVECVSKLEANQVSPIGRNHSHGSYECHLSVYVCVQVCSEA